MRIPTAIQALSAAAALALLAGCSSGSAIAPKPSAPQGHGHAMKGRPGTLVLGPIGQLKFGLRTKPGYRGASFNACPPTGLVVYVSDAGDNTVNIFAGHLANQSPCGILTGFVEPQGLTVHNDVLYVANTIGDPSGQFGNIEAFHRGATSPFRTYTDTSCGGEYPTDPAVSNDNVVLAANIISNQCAGSISTWNRVTQTLIGNFPNIDNSNTFFLTIQKNGATYYDGFNANGFATLTGGSCVAGNCSGFADTVAALTFPGGIRSDNGEHVLLDDQLGAGGGTASEYAPPNFGSTVGVCTEAGVDPVTIDLKHTGQHLFYADAGQGRAFEMSHFGGGGSGCIIFGSAATTGGFPIGVAVDIPIGN